MKKLLLIVVLALGVVACEKNDLGEMNSNSINPLNNVKVGMTKQDAFNFINDSAFEFKANKNVKSFDARKSTLNSIQVGFFTGHGDTFAHLVSEDVVADTCYDNFTAVSTFDYIWNSPTLTVVDLSDNSEKPYTLGTAELQARYNGIFDATSNSVFFINYNSSGTPSTRLGVPNPVLQTDGTFSL